MMLITMKFKRIFIDTNTLIYHTFENFDIEKHAQVVYAFSVFEQHASELFISNQVLREFYAISTNRRVKLCKLLSLRQILMMGL
jgi:predicted nucleic acid-binding protein